jgi:hypothetical protein
MANLAVVIGLGLDFGGAFLLAFPSIWPVRILKRWNKRELTQLKAE